MKSFEIGVKKSVVFYLHGLRGHGFAQRAALEHIVKNLSTRIVSLELPGHGEEALQQQCMVPSYKAVVKQIVHEVKDHANNAEQVILMGYSFGATLMSLATIELENDTEFEPDVAGFIGICTAFNVGHNVSPWVLVLSRIIAPISRFLHRYARPLSDYVTIHEMDVSRISPDPVIQQSIVEDELMYKGRVPLNTSSQVHQAGVTALQQFEKIKCDVLLLHSMDDTIALAPKQAMFKRPVDLVLFKNLGHNCIDGLRREAVIARKKIIQFILATL